MKGGKREDVLWSGKTRTRTITSQRISRVSINSAEMRLGPNNAARQLLLLVDHSLRARSLIAEFAHKTRFSNSIEKRPIRSAAPPMRARLRARIQEEEERRGGRFEFHQGFPFPGCLLVEWAWAVGIDHQLFKTVRRSFRPICPNLDRGHTLIPFVDVCVSPRPSGGDLPGHPPASSSIIRTRTPGGLEDRSTLWDPDPQGGQGMPPTSWID